MRRCALGLVPFLSFALLAPLSAHARPGTYGQAPPPMPKPGPEMAKVQFLLGNWHVEEVVEASVMGPGGKGHGSATVTSGPGGMSVHVVYTSESPKGPMPGFKGEGLMAWDEEAKVYKQAWTDNFGVALMISTGHWEGEVLVFDTEGKLMGKAFKARDRFTGISANGFTLSSEMSLDGSPMQKVMALVHTRKK